MPQASQLTRTAWTGNISYFELNETWSFEPNRKELCEKGKFFSEGKTVAIHEITIIPVCVSHVLF